MYGGPSPRMRALANQDRLTLRSLAASFGVSSTMVGADGFWAIAPAADVALGGRFSKLVVIGQPHIQRSTEPTCRCWLVRIGRDPRPYREGFFRSDDKPARHRCTQ